MRGRVLHNLLLALLIACSKKKEEPVAAPPPPPPSAAPVASASVSAVAPIASASAPVVDDAIDSDFVLHEDLVLPEGKQLPLPKITPAAKDAITAHAATIQTHYEEIVKQGFKQVKRFNASWIPATYIVFEKPAKGEEPAKAKMLEVEGESTNEVELANANNPLDLWNTPRGYFIDVTGDDRLTYFLRRSDTDFTECVGKVWNMNTGTVDTLKELPLFPTRAKDVDGDGKNDFPIAIFGYELAGFVHQAPPTTDTVCNIKREGKVTIDVVGVEGKGSYKSFYESRLKAARARATRVRKWIDEPKKRKKGALRFTKECALDVAQAAAEVFVYQRVLGTGADTAIVDADNAMKEFAIKPSACEGISNKNGDTDKDQWPDMRASLMSFAPPKI